MKKMIAVVLVVVGGALAGCGGSTPDAATATTPTRAERDQAALEHAHDTFVADCEESGVVAEGRFGETSAEIANIVGRRPDERLPNGSTPREMADALVAAMRATEVCSSEVQTLELVLAPE